MKLIPNIFIALFLFNCTTVFSQGRKELIKFADAAFESGNYSSAAYFYGKIVGSFASDEKDLVYPYQLTPWNMPPKQSQTDSIGAIDTTALFSKDTTALTQPIDTVVFTSDILGGVDSASTVNADTAMKKNTVYRYALYRLAESYRFSYDYENAEKFYARCLEDGITEYPFLRYWYAESLKQNMKYSGALRIYNDFTNLYQDQESRDGIDYLQRTEIGSAGCVFALNSINNPTKDIVVKEADSVFNIGSSNFAVRYLQNDSSILFTSARPGSKITNKGQKAVWFCDLYKSTQTKKGWTNPKNFGTPINTLIHEGAGMLSPDMHNLYFTRWSGTTEQGERAIYISKFFNNQWMQPMKLNENVNMPGYLTMQPAFSADENILFFVSDRPGGYGKMDIWYCTIDEYGNTGVVTNLGPVVNTTEDDVAPFYHTASNILYFSSKGHIGMGGLDIFAAEGTIGDWSEPENLGYPVNSGRDDIYFVLNSNRRKGFLTSDRKNCLECDGGSCYHIYEVEYIPIKYSLSGYVYSKKTGEIISNALITFKDVLNNLEPFFIITDETGFYSTPLRKNLTYFIKAQKVKYFADATTITTVGLDVSTILVHDFHLARIPSGEIEIKGIYYDYDKWDLRPESKITLDSLVWFLNLNDNIVIELSSHTDDRGDSDYNLELSQKRAQAVVDYLIEEGIEKSRFTPVGYGKIKPIVENAKTEKEHQQNRRTAFSVLAQDYLSKKK